MFRGFKIELVTVERQIEGRETLGIVGHPKLKWHFCIVKQPELRIKTDLIEALNQRDVATDIELVLELRVHLE
jgi:hypothetical protein